MNLNGRLESAFKLATNQSLMILDTDFSNTYENLRLLIDAGADVNATDIDGNTALLNIFGSAKHTTRRRADMHLLLKAGAKINMRNIKHRNAIQQYVHACDECYREPDRTMVLLMYAAGESLRGLKMKHRLVVESCLADDLSLGTICLKYLCREAIRKYLLELNYHENLFNRVPKLGLPPTLSKYLLFIDSLRNK